MTAPIAAEYQGPRLDIKGLVRERLMPADSPNLCAQPEHLPKFMRVIDLTVDDQTIRNSARGPGSRAIAAAKEVCGDCPSRLVCLRVNGPDFRLGVVGGLTDTERRQLFKDGAA